MDRRIAALADRQFGVFSRRQCLALGLTNRAIEHRLTTGRWLRVRRGVYRIAGAPTSWRQDVTVACLATGGVASARTAAALYELAGQPPGMIEVVVERARAPRPPGVRVHRARSLPKSDLTTVDGVPCTAIARTLLDLASAVPVSAFEVALDDALRRRLSRLADLHRYARSASGRGGATLRTALARRAETGPTSVLETAFLRLLRKAGLPDPRCQYKVRNGGRVVAVIDFAYPEQHLAIEVDGYRFHSGRREWERDLARQNELVRLGYEVLRFTSTDVDQRPDETVTRVAIALARYGENRSSPRAG